MIKFIKKVLMFFYSRHHFINSLIEKGMEIKALENTITGMDKHNTALFEAGLLQLEKIEKLNNDKLILQKKLDKIKKLDVYSKYDVEGMIECEWIHFDDLEGLIK